MRRIGVAWVAAFVLGGCCSANVTILPKEGGQAQAISTAGNEDCALEKARAEAKDYCMKEGKRYVMINRETEYEGVDPNVRLAIGLLTPQSGSTNDDHYRVQLDFKCE